MKRIKLGSVEILGYTGIAVWVAVVLLRQYSLSANALYWFWFGILPNLGAAWFVTMLLKWFVIFGLKKTLTVRLYLHICVGVLLLALASEIVHHLFLNSPFDIYDMLITVVAQFIVFFVPIVAKDKYFGNYDQESNQT